MPNCAYSRTNVNGTIRCYNEKGQYHNSSGPAISFRYGAKIYIVNGKLHNLDGPALVDPDGTGYYYINGKSLTRDEWNSLKSSQ